MAESPQPPPQPPTQPQPTPYWQSQSRETRGVAFYVAIFLALLLLVSAGLNLVLLLVTTFSAFDPATMSVEDSSGHRLVPVGGARDARNKILRIPIDGAIAEASSPLIGGAGGTVTEVERALRLASRDESIRAVLIDVNSPGGGVTDSDAIHRAVTEFRRMHPSKPVVALLGDIAASGGYYVAVAAEKIYSRPTTITGSIGVILQTWNVAEAMDNLGIAQVTIVSERTPYKDMLSPTRPPRSEEIAMLRSIVDEMYDRFVDVVAAGRPKLTREQVVALANGALYSAMQAMAGGLVDEIHDLGSALDRIAADHPETVGHAQLVELRRIPTLLEALTGARQRNGGIGAVDNAVERLLGATTGSKLLYYWPGGR